MTPNEIAVFLHYAVFDRDHPQAQQDWVKMAIEHLVATGLLEVDSKNLTNKGAVWLTMLRNTPLPEQEWVDPR